MIEKHPSLVHADRILARLRKIWPRGWTGLISCWSGGREQGYHLDVYSDGHVGAADFAETRNSDSAVVVVGGYEEFDFDGRPKAELWPSAKHFLGDGEAARWIVDQLKIVSRRKA